MKKQSKVNVRFQPREASRIISKNALKKGTVQLQAHITWQAKEEMPLTGQIKLPDGDYAYAPAKEDYTVHLIKEHNGDMGGDMIRRIQKESPKRYKLAHKTVGIYKISKDGGLLHYASAKLQTGLFILPESWNRKEQKAELPYERLNLEIAKIKHVIKITFEELYSFKNFSKEMFQSEIKNRLKYGMKQVLTISPEQLQSTNSTVNAVSNFLVDNIGLNPQKISNPENVPDDLMEFVEWYPENRKAKHKQSVDSVEQEKKLAGKLKRYFEQTKRSISITTSSEKDYNDLFHWRMRDNELNTTRNSEKVKSKIQTNESSGELIAMITYNKFVDTVVTFLNRASREFGCKIPVNTSNIVFERGKEISDPRKDVFLTIQELKQLVDLDLEPKSRLFIHRDLFVLGCLSGGYRIKDLTTLPPPVLTEFKDKVGKVSKYYIFDVESHKTNVHSKTPVPQELNHIIERYNFGQKITDNYLRDDIKDLGELCGWTEFVTYKQQLADGTFKTVSDKRKFQRLQSKTCRKTYCSLLVNYWDFEIAEASKFSGHTSDEFKKYLLIDKDISVGKFVDKMNLKPLF